jgi:hypothetical protein
MHGVAGEAQPPTRIAKPNYLYAGPHSEGIEIRPITRDQSFHTVFRSGTFRNFKIRMAEKNLPRLSKYPPATISDLAVRNRLQIRSERRTEHPHDLLGGIKWHAAYEK